MQKSKTSKSGDRLGELPDSLIFEIFWFLPITDVVRTIILSKRWKGLWKTAPFLNLNDSTMEKLDDYRTRVDRARGVVNRALMLWSGVKILKFKVDFPVPYNYTAIDNIWLNHVDVWVLLATENGAEEVYLNLWADKGYIVPRNLYGDWKSLSAKRDTLLNDVDVWLLLATKNGAEEVYLHLGEMSGYKEYLVPQCLYSCSSLKVLSLRSCRLVIHGNIKWDQLKSLTIGSTFCSVNFVTENAVNLILNGSPKLEVFALTLKDSPQSLCIQSSSLRKLSITKHSRGSYFCVGPSKDTVLKIWTPNLERLKMVGIPYSKCVLLDVSSLSDANLCFYSFGSMKYDYLLEEALGQILPSIRLVETVTLSDWSIKVLGIMKKKHSLSPLSNVKVLNFVSSTQVEMVEMAGLLEIFPNVKRLSLSRRNYKNNEDSLESEPINLAKLSLLQLRTIEIACLEGDNFIFPLIKILLKYASKLEKMVFQVGYLSPELQRVLKMPPRPSRRSNYLSCASQKVRKMPRSSPTAQLIFREKPSD
ncbi:F-box/LRR-repeat protein At3g26922-like [Salvia miltiorrhiza]|uniref:F-box/LRR-repeat protein At3g26922-like n=1 Tax=Salvia miltiorrhiza TaxID=226208 RepID=UPI0025ACA136|nr:F-box/LRR-repeat protein At3g26922-like [Salvia miltiorrhiza]